MLVANGSPFFENLQKAAGIDQPIAAYLIKPVQRLVIIITTEFPPKKDLNKKFKKILKKILKFSLKILKKIELF